MAHSHTESELLYFFGRNCLLSVEKRPVMAVKFRGWLLRRSGSSPKIWLLGATCKFDHKKEMAHLS